MQPLKPRERARILNEHPDVAPGEIDEYERLLAERFAADPDLPPAAGARAQADRREARLAELYGKLFRAKVSAGEHGW